MYHLTVTGVTFACLLTIMHNTKISKIQKDQEMLCHAPGTQTPVVMFDGEPVRSSGLGAGLS
jgi:hypothetical protein